MDIQAYMDTLRIEVNYAMKNTEYCNSVHSRTGGNVSYAYYCAYESWHELLDVLCVECYRVATR